MGTPDPARHALLCGHIAREVHLRLRDAPQEGSYVEILSRVESLGGSAAFGALAIAAPDLAVTILGPIPADPYARAAGERFARLGIRWLPTSTPPRTAVFYSMYAPGRGRWVVHDPVSTTGDEITSLPEADFVILYPFAPRDALAIAAIAHGRGTPLVLAPSASLFRRPEIFRELCRLATWVVLNADEAAVYDSMACDHIVVTSGPDGAVLIDGGEERRSRTSPLHGCLDAGAGDVLSAVFAANLFVRGWDPLQSLEAAQAAVYRFLARGDVPLEAHLP